MDTLYKIAKTGAIQIWQAVVDGADLVVTHGKQDGKQQRSVTTCKPKNIGRANETTAEQQAIAELAALYTSQQDNKHYRFSVEEAQAVVDECIVPMKISNYKDVGNKIDDVCYIQNKFNGSRLMFKDGKYVSKAGREEFIKVPHIDEQVKALGLDLDAEVYCHGMSLQQIRSAWLKPNENTENLNLYIFDVPVANIPFSERLVMLEAMAERIQELGLKNLIVIPTKLVSIRRAHDRSLRHAIADGFEGIVLRNIDSLFEFGNRSNQTQKWKPRYDAEAKVLGVIKDKKGNGTLQCITSDVLGNKEFKVVMKVKRRDGLEHSKSYEEMLKLVGEWITFSYEELSDNGIPTKPVGEVVRICNDAGEPQE